MNGQTNKVVLSLGSNLGDKQKHLLEAIHALMNIPQTVFIQSSEIWKTAAWGNINQDDFLNCVVVIETSLSPEVLLETLIQIEEKLGRTRTEKWGPRIIDIDILFFGDLIMNTEQITIPHPEIQNRKFVLAPLNEIVPEFIHPVYKKTMAALLVDCYDKSSVSIVEK